MPRPLFPSETLARVGGKEWETTKYHVPPAAASICTIHDTGACSCEFMRCTTFQLPGHHRTACIASIPLAVVCQPFATLTADEDPVPVVDLGESGPMRCTRCKAYVCPFFTWLRRGREAGCCFCGHRIEVPEEYRCSLDETGGRRQDYDERPELWRGTVDFVAPSDYGGPASLPGPPVTIFVLDSSAKSVESGFFGQLVRSIGSLLPYMHGPAARMAIMTFDEAVHFYSFSAAGEDAHMVCMTDVEDPFVPCPPETLCGQVDVDSIRAKVEGLLDRLLTYTSGQTCDLAAGGAALKAATELAASSGGGHVLMFHATLPNTGVGALRDRDDISLYSSGAPASLYQPQEAAFYAAIASACNRRHVGVSVCGAPPANAYIDMATLSHVPRKTGGEVMFLPAFDLRRDGEGLHYAVARAVTQEAAYGCAFKLRCSRRLQVDSMAATWDAAASDQSTFRLARMSPDATGLFRLSFSEEEEGIKHAYLQAACLYTNRMGQRLIRVQTLQLTATLSLSSVFANADVEAVTSVLVKLVASAALGGGTGYRDQITKMCVDMLFAYRHNCTSATSAGQLILPESLKLLPLYVGTLRKLPALRAGHAMRADERVVSLVRMLGLPAALVAPLVYPRVYTAHPLDSLAGCPTCVGGYVRLPATLACSLENLAPAGMYLVDDGMSIQLYIRAGVTAEEIRCAFGVDSVAEIHQALSFPNDLPDPGSRLCAMIQQLRCERQRLPWQPLGVVAAGTPGEARLFSMLVEDSMAGEMPYIDFLCHVHKQVRNKMG